MGAAGAARPRKELQRTNGNLNRRLRASARSIKLGQFNFFWKLASFCWNWGISNGEPSVARPDCSCKAPGVAPAAI